LTEAELNELIDRDPIAALCHVVRECGATMTLHGVPVGEAELRSSAEHSARELLEAAIERGIRAEVDVGGEGVALEARTTLSPTRNR